MDTVLRILLIRYKVCWLLFSGMGRTVAMLCVVGVGKCCGGMKCLTICMGQ